MYFSNSNFYELENKTIEDEKNRPEVSYLWEI